MFSKSFPRIFWATAFFLVAFLPVRAQQNSRFLSYIAQYKDLAIQEMLRYKIPASITLAQGLLESGAGSSELCLKGNNHFGIKCHGWRGRSVYHDDDETGECFRAYDTAFDSYEDHSKFLSQSQRYSRLFQLSQTDYRGWARGLKECGYATNPQYANNLIRIIELYQLYEYDYAKTYDKFVVRHSTTEKVTPSPRGLHPIRIYNKNYYIIARRGDTYKSIGQEIGISYKKIASYNERDKDDALQEGEIVWLKKKQKRAERQFKKYLHIVRPGESMYSIAQKYGIRLKNLYKMNHLPPSYNIRVGDALRLY